MRRDWSGKTSQEGDEVEETTSVTMASRVGEPACAQSRGWSLVRRQGWGRQGNFPVTATLSGVALSLCCDC